MVLFSTSSLLPRRAFCARWRLVGQFPPANDFPQVLFDHLRMLIVAWRNARLSHFVLTVFMLFGFELHQCGPPHEGKKSRRWQTAPVTLLKGLTEVEPWRFRTIPITPSAYLLPCRRRRSMSWRMTTKSTELMTNCTYLLCAFCWLLREHLLHQAKICPIYHHHVPKPGCERCPEAAGPEPTALRPSFRPYICNFYTLFFLQSLLRLASSAKYLRWPR